MREQLLNQYRSIQQTLSCNVETIKRLIEQAETLSQIAEKINGTSSADVELKEKLTNEVAQIKESIASLIKQTNNLFDLYNQFADALFSSK